MVKTELAYTILETMKKAVAQVLVKQPLHVDQKHHVNAAQGTSSHE